MTFSFGMRKACIGLFFLMMLAGSLFPVMGWAESAEPVKKSSGALPPQVETALGELLEATLHNRDQVAEKAVSAVLSYVGTLSESDSPRPASGKHGAGAYLRDSIAVPVRDLIPYMVDPKIPGEALYPTSIRQNRWLPGSDILKNSRKILDASLPPTAPVLVRGLEFEEITPDTSSGCYYEYKLQRLFLLTAYEGRTALVSVSLMPKESSVGHRGAIVGADKDWTYVYTPTQGTNLTMMTWAETYLYGSASVSIFIESAPGSAKTDIFIFKWAKAGWSGMNVIKESHITAGLKRFLAGFKQVMTSPNRPSPQSIANRFAELSGSADASLRDQLSGLSGHLEKVSTTQKSLQEKDFQAVLKNGSYAQTFNHEDLVSELMKWYMRGQIGTLPW